MAEKYSAQKLKELCYEFIFKNLKTLDEKLLMGLYEALPLLGEKAWLELVEGRAQNTETSGNVAIANKVLGINLADPFKKRADFQSDDDYKGYLMTRMKPNMLVLCNKASYWGGETQEFQHELSDRLGRPRSSSMNSATVSQRVYLPKGTIGRVLSFDIKGAKVKWSNGIFSSKDYSGSFIDLDLLTPPIATSLFND